MNLKGKEFEALIMFRAQKLEADRILTLGRFGVQAVMMNSKLPPFKPEWQVIKSLPDFDGCIFGTGRQLVIEAKVCSQASYPLLAAGRKAPKQIDYMLKRAEFNALCFLLIHFNGRELMKRSDPPATYAIPVHPKEHFWREYQAVDRKSLTRQEAELYGIEVPWNQWSSRSDKLSPDLRVLLPAEKFTLNPA